MTFNCGIGMIVCIAAEDEKATLEILAKQGERAFVIGEIVSAAGTANRVTYL